VGVRIIPSMAMPAPGALAPEFVARATTGQRLKLADYHGKYLVLFFFPKAFTPGCTREAVRFRDNSVDLKALGAEVLGVSLDDMATQCDFAARNTLNYPLIADDDGRVSELYGVKRALLPVDKRITFIIDPQGRVAARFEHQFQVNKHLDKVVEFLRKLASSPAQPTKT
jgi:peroxiredoxin Q/BCP